MNLFTKTKSFLSYASNDPLVTELKGHAHRLVHSNGLMELSFNLSESQRDEFNVAAQALLVTRNSTIEAGATRSSSLISAAKQEFAQTTDAAHAAYRRAVFALFTRFGQLPSEESLAAFETPIGEPLILGPTLELVPVKK